MNAQPGNDDARPSARNGGGGLVGGRSSDHLPEENVAGYWPGCKENDTVSGMTDEESFLPYLSTGAQAALIKLLSMPDHFLCTKPAKQFCEWFRWDRNSGKRCLQELRMAGHAHECRVRNAMDTGYIRTWKFSEWSSGLPPQVHTIYSKQYAIHGYAAVAAEMKQEEESKHHA